MIKIHDEIYDDEIRKNEPPPGNPLHNSSTEVEIFFSEILSYFCLFVAAFNPCHGSVPRLKYMRTYPRDSMSSRRDCSEIINILGFVPLLIIVYFILLDNVVILDWYFYSSYNSGMII